MGRFVDLPKDVVWLILRDVIMHDARLPNSGAYYWETPCGNQFPEKTVSERSSQSGFVTREIALICKFTLNIIRSKCIYAKKDKRFWSFIKGALTSSYK